MLLPWIDSDVALIGSSNPDIRSFDLSAEVGLLICDRAVVAALVNSPERGNDQVTLSIFKESFIR